MLESKVSLNEEICKSRDFINTLKNNGLDSNIINELKSDDWYNKINKKDLKKLATISTPIVEDNVDIKFKEEKLNLGYKNYNLMKKIFLINLSTVWESSITMSSAYNTMRKIDELEEEMGKCVLNFTVNEIKRAVVDLFHDLRYHKLRYQINMITKMQDFYKDNIKVNSYWEKVKSNDELKKIVGEEIKEGALTKKDLVNLSKIMPNIQDSIIPLLIFEGVAFSKIDDKDELRYIKKEDLKDNTLHLYGSRNREGSREIELTSEVAELVKDAINQDFMEKKHRDNSLKIVELESSPYVLRPTIKAKRKKETVSDDRILSFRGGYSRLNLSKEFIEATLYDVPFTPKSIEMFGKVYYMSKYINDGYDENESAKMTLQRFGDWYTEKENSSRDTRNSQLINRLKKVWGLYKK